MKIFLGADHAGVIQKNKIKKYLKSKRYSFEDCGSNESHSADDYVDYAEKVARKVVKTKNSKGILFCGSGLGMVMAANKIKGIRAATGFDLYSARMARFDNDANILGLRTRYFSTQKIKKIVHVWLTTPFSGIKRHQKRINKLAKLENKK